MIDKLLPTGDNGQVKQEDFKLLDYGDELMPKILLMPKLDMQIFNYSQYTNTRYNTGCTIMSAINAISTIENKIFSAGEISSIFDKAEAMGWRPGYGWMRGSGWDCVRKRWNEKYPNNKMMLFVVDIFTEEFNLILERLGIVGTSISVDSRYWSDVRDNLVLDLDIPFSQIVGHATCMMYNNKYFCVDSVYQKDKNIPMTYVRGSKDRIKGLINTANLRSDVHIIIMEKWLKVIAPDEKARLLEMKAKVELAIQTNSELRYLTKSQEEKAERQKMNNYNRGKLAIINAYLS